jgi:hypothetical protein
VVPAARSVAVVLEVGKRRTFASAADWPGWCRSGKGINAALEALSLAAVRYAPVVTDAGLRLPAAPRFEVVEHVQGDASTDFGAPGAIADIDRRDLTAADARRLAALVEASWQALDRVAASAPATLRKGPRGGGRDRDAIVTHVDEAEAAYASKLGLKVRQLERPARRSEIAAAIQGARSGAVPDRHWPPRYAARRVAWHVLDHAWEIEDRSTP